MFLNPQIVFRREFDGSGLLFHPDTGEVFALNPTAAAICELIAAGERDEAETSELTRRSTRLPAGGAGRSADLPGAAAPAGIPDGVTRFPASIRRKAGGGQKNRLRNLFRSRSEGNR